MNSRIEESPYENNGESSETNTQEWLKEWEELFAKEEDWRLLLQERKPALGQLFRGNPGLAKLFFDYPAWKDVFFHHEEATQFLTSDLNRLKLFIPHPLWIELFKDKPEELIKNFEANQSWGKSFIKQPDWQALFISKPEWVKLFLRKSEWFERLSGDINWARQLAKDEKWGKIFDEDPEWALVFACELKQTTERQKKYKLGNDRDNLIGLAISGGGIRSASFGLGVLEALRDFHILQKIDYLSTVSGGGYIGAWLSANCKRVAEDGAKDWLVPEAKENWDDSIRHLRRYSNYLSPKIGFFSADTWTMAAVWLRNTLLIQLMVILGIGALLLTPRLLFPLFIEWPEAGNLPWIEQLIEINRRWMTVILFIIGVSGIAWNTKRLVKKKQKNWLLDFLPSAVCFIGAVCLNLFGDKINKVLNEFFNKLFISINPGFKPLSTQIDFQLFSAQISYAKQPVQLAIAVIVALLLVIGTYLLLSAVIRFRAETNQKSVSDYSQPKVQILVVVPMLIVGFFTAAILWGHVHSDPMRNWNSFGQYLSQAWEYWPFQLTVVVVSLSLLSFCSIREKKDMLKDYNEESDNIEENHGADQTLLIKAIWDLLKALLISIPPTFVLYASISAIMLQFHDWISLAEERKMLDEEGKWLAFVWGPSLVLLAFALTVVVLLGVLGRLSSEGIREWWSRLGAWLAIYGFAWLAIVAAAVYGPLWSARLYYEGSWEALSTGWIGTTLAGLLAGKSASTKGTDGQGVAVKIKEVIAKGAPLVFIAGLLIAVSMILHLVVAINSTFQPPFEVNRENLLGYIEQPSNKVELKLDAKPDIHIDVSSAKASIPESSAANPPEYGTHWELLSHQSAWVVFILFIGCLTGMALLGWRVDINEFSFNNFYRNRLARCFLGATCKYDKRDPHNFTGFDDKDDLPLSDLTTSSGPLHIINCALNLGGSSDLALHTRHSANFVLTPNFCGSSYKIKKDGLQDGGVEIGYSLTNAYGGKIDQPTLGQAIAVSGAAASPNMGYHTSPVTAFLLTLFNVRLGWWFPNPYNPKIKQSSPSFGLKYLLMELFGEANEDSSYLSISDGGHFENLAAYELIRRRCKVVIISDAECDPGYQFEGLGTLIRMCNVDFGAKLKIDVRSIRPDGESLWSRCRCAVGKIIYKDKTEGTLIYIKACMNGHENTDILQYKAAHPNFPHETTGDQFYSEDQFESYRSLGLDITKQLFNPIMRKINPDTGCYEKDLNELNLVESAERLQAIWSPFLPSMGQFSRHTDRLMDLWCKVSQNRYLKFLDTPSIGFWAESADPKTPEESRAAFYLFSELIQLMENVYIDLNLEETWDHPDNEGWRTLFLQWKCSPVFQQTWDQTEKTYGLRFRYFCERHLSLSISKEL